MRWIKLWFSILMFLVSINIWAEQKLVVCTNTILADMTKNIAKNKVKIISILPVGSDPHVYEPLPKDAKLISKADLIVKNGLKLEGWLDKLILVSSKNNFVCNASDGISPIKAEDLHSSPDPHIWMNPNLAKIMIKNINLSLQKLDPTNSNFYEQNYLSYLEKIIKLDRNIDSLIQLIPIEKRLLVTSHDAFKYFGKRYDIDVDAALGTSTDAEVQIIDMQRIVRKIKERNINCIFVESSVNPKLINQIARDQGITIGGKLFTDSVDDTLKPTGTYLGMLEHNSKTIFKGLYQSNKPSSEIKNIEKANMPLLLFTVFAIFSIVFAIVFYFIHPSYKNVTLAENYTLDIQNLSVAYGRKRVLSNITLTLESGKLYGLLGPNGAGKSTLFKSILGLVKPDSGKILINNQPIEEVRKKIAYIPQKEDIDWTFPATVLDIVLTGRLPHKSKFKTYNQKDVKKVLEALSMMGMEDFIDRQIGDLSGGQQQRVFIARALCQEADILLFDEPFVGVDVTTEEKIVQIIKKLADLKKTIIIIHHDLTKVKEYFSHVMMVNQRLIAFGETDSTFTEENIQKTYSGKLDILQETEKYI